MQVAQDVRMHQHWQFGLFSKHSCTLVRAKPCSIPDTILNDGTTKEPGTVQWDWGSTIREICRRGCGRERGLDRKKSLENFCFLQKKKKNLRAQKANLGGKELQVKDRDSAKFFALTFLYASSLGTGRHLLDWRGSMKAVNRQHMFLLFSRMEFWRICCSSPPSSNQLPHTQFGKKENERLTG